MKFLPLFILGSTAVGKSEVALRLAERTGAAILVMDAMQVYRGLDIGVGKPTQDQLKRVPHAGIDLVHWTEPFDVARYVAMAIEFLNQAKQPVIICGGTGLYYQALTQGLCEVPAAPQELRETLSQMSLVELQKRLKRIDPELYSKLDRQNPRRLQRAIECMETTGRSLQTWQQETPEPPLLNFQAVWLQRPKETMRERIINRVHSMLEAGWLKEVEVLLNEAGEGKLARCPAIGYKELMAVCLKRVDIHESERLICLQTLHYAKRQMTWFKKAPKLIPIPAGDSVEETGESLRSHGTLKMSLPWLIY